MSFCVGVGYQVLNHFIPFFSLTDTGRSGSGQLLVLWQVFKWNTGNTFPPSLSFPFLPFPFLSLPSLLFSSPNPSTSYPSPHFFVWKFCFTVFACSLTPCTLGPLHVRSATNAANDVQTSLYHPKNWSCVSPSKKKKRGKERRSGKGQKGGSKGKSFKGVYLCNNNQQQQKQRHCIITWKLRVLLSFSFLSVGWIACWWERFVHSTEIKCRNKRVRRGGWGWGCECSADLSIS